MINLFSKKNERLETVEKLLVSQYKINLFLIDKIKTIEEDIEKLKEHIKILNDRV